MSRTYKQNRKLPFTKRNEYNEKDELDSGDIEISFPDKAKATKTINGFDRHDRIVAKDQLSNSSKLLKCCCGQRCWKISESFDRKKYPHPFRFLDFLATVFSILFFYYDVISDIFLAHTYFSMKRWIEFGFTSAFIFLPLLVLNAKSLRWYWFDYMRERNGRGNTSCAVWIFRVLFTFPLMMGPVVR